MSLAPQHVATLEQAGGFILEQLVAAQAITAEQQTAILAQQQQIEQDTGEKPFVGQLLEQNGIDTSHIKQPLLDLQATARTLLHAHGENAAAERCEGAYGAIDLAQGVPDNKWTLADMESGDPAKEHTALLQTRLVQTKVLAQAANMLEAAGQEVPASTLQALRASQDAAREGFGMATQALRQAGQSPESLEQSFHGLPDPLPTVSQHDIQIGVAEAIGALETNGLLEPQAAETLLNQESKRSADIRTMQARRQARTQGASVQQDAATPETQGSHLQNLLDARAQQGKSGRSV